jgi:hypothetical protein
MADKCHLFLPPTLSQFWGPIQSVTGIFRCLISTLLSSASLHFPEGMPIRPAKLSADCCSRSIDAGQAEGNDVLACSCGAFGRSGCAGFRISRELGGSRRGSRVDFRAVSGRVPVPSVWLGQMAIRGLSKGLLPQARLPESSRASSYPPAWDRGLRRPETVRGGATPEAGLVEESTPSN